MGKRLDLHRNPGIFATHPGTVNNIGGLQISLRRVKVPLQFLGLLLICFRGISESPRAWAQGATPTATKILESGDFAGDQLEGMGNSSGHIPSRLTDSGRMGLWVNSSDFTSQSKFEPFTGQTITNYGGTYLFESSAVNKATVFGDQISINVGGGNIRPGTIEIQQIPFGIGFSLTDVGNMSPMNGSGEYVFEGRLVVPVRIDGFPDFDTYDGIFSLSGGQYSLRVLKVSIVHDTQTGFGVQTIGPLYNDVSEQSPIIQLNDNHAIAFTIQSPFTQGNRVVVNDTPLELPSGFTQSLKLNNQGNVASIRQNFTTGTPEVYFNSTRLFGVGNTVTSVGAIQGIHCPIALNDLDQLAVVVDVLNPSTGFVEPTVLAAPVTVAPLAANIALIAGSTATLGGAFAIRFASPFGLNPAIGSPHAFNSFPDLLIIGGDAALSGDLLPSLRVYHVDFADGIARLSQRSFISDLHLGTITARPFFAAMNGSDSVGYSIQNPRQGITQGTYMATLASQQQPSCKEASEFAVKVTFGNSGPALIRRPAPLTNNPSDLQYNWIASRVRTVIPCRGRQVCDRNPITGEATIAEAFGITDTAGGMDFDPTLKLGGGPFTAGLNTGPTKNRIGETFCIVVSCCRRFSFTNVLVRADYKIFHPDGSVVKIRPREVGGPTNKTSVDSKFIWPRTATLQDVFEGLEVVPVSGAFFDNPSFGDLQPGVQFIGGLMSAGQDTKIQLVLQRYKRHAQERKRDIRMPRRRRLRRAVFR